MSDSDFKTEEASAGIQFFPPLYTQRYVLALNILMEHNIQSVVDFGCSECGLLKLLPTASCITKAALVDIDRPLLVSKRKAINPELHHFLQRRPNPLHISLFCGSAETMDSRIQGFEAATLIEVIEHLYPETLARVTENVFGCLRPRLCFVTTPNSEFNVLFKNKDPKQLRHWDHKFEWTRSEFCRWCDSICFRFGYSVNYTGVGRITTDLDSARVGPCTQGAVFTIKMPLGPQEQKSHPPVSLEMAQKDPDEVYELIAESEFPYLKDNLSEEEKLDMEVSFCLREIVRNDESDVAYGEELSVSVARVAEYRSVKALADLDAVRISLERQLFNLTPSKNHVVIVAQDSSSSEEELEEDDYEHLYDEGGCVSGENKPKQEQVVSHCLHNVEKVEHSNVEEQENWEDVG